MLDLPPFLQFSEANFDESTVRQWIAERCMPEKYEALFLKLTLANKLIQHY